MNPNHQTGRLIRDRLPLLVDVWQSVHPDRLLSTEFVALEAAEALGVTRAAIYRNLTEAVAEARLVEILMHRTWRISLPGASLPPLYAVAGDMPGDGYLMVLERPQSRGSARTSFLTTPKGFVEFLKRQRAAHGNLVPSARSE